MKIGLVLERFDPVRGGLEHWTWQFARQLTRRGHEVHVVAFEFYDDAVRDGIIAHKLEMPESRLDRAALLAAELPAMGFDVVHDMGIGWTADVIHPHGGSTKALWEHNLMRIPKWRQIRFWREKRYRELAELEQCQLANSNAVIVAVSHMVVGHFEKYHGLSPSRMRVIYNGVEVEMFTPANRSKYRESTRHQLGIDHEVMFLMLAHNLLLKNADATIRAAAKLVSGGASLRLVIAGGKRPDRFKKLAKQLNIAESVTFLEQVDPLPYYAAADVFVHPTWYDPCSLVTLEASSSGLPVITSRFNGASEFMTDGKEGFVLAQPADVDTLASHMNELLDPGVRDRMGTAARSLAMQHTFEKQTNEFLDLYREIIANKKTVAS